MAGRLDILLRTARGRAALGAATAAMGVAAVAWPCACPDHVAPAAQASTQHVAAAQGAHAAHLAGAAHAAGTTRDPISAVSAPARTTTGTPSHHGAPSHQGGSIPQRRNVSASTSAAFDVGSRAKPLVAEGPSGPLWKPTAPRKPGTSMPGMAAQAPRAGASDAAAPAATTDDATATRAVLTTTQATRRLSRRCQRLIKAKRVSKLSKADRKRRATCIAKRRAIVEASKPKSEGAPSTGVGSPAAPIQGPVPTATPAAPIAGTPTPAPGTQPGTPTPTPGPSGPDPATVQCNAVGLKARDVDPLKPFAMTRGVACTSSTGTVNFELQNGDRQFHNLGVQLPGQANSLVSILDAVPAGDTLNANVKLNPGTYEIVCMVPGHGAMTVQITILTKADYIAQGYAG